MDNRLIRILGVVLIILGLGSLIYNGFTYTKQEEVARIGNLKLTADEQKTVTVSPIFGGIALAAGIILVVFVRRRG